MDSLLQHFTNQPALAFIALASLLIAVSSIPYFMAQHKRYGSATAYASKNRKRITGLSALIFVGLFIYGLTPYVEPPTGQIAVVLGNTQNTPRPVLAQDIAEAIEGTMLVHKGEDVFELVDSIKIISATGKPKVVDLDVTQLKLREIGNNNSNAKRAANINVKAIQDYVNTLDPTDNGSNYLEAIKLAKDNLDEGSKIIVIGSGLSDSGDLNFSKTRILTNEEQRNEVIQKIREKNGSDYLKGYSIMFYGLGDTTAPQEALPTAQKNVVRTIYKTVVRSMGGDVEMSTKTQPGEPIETKYIVGTTDTGCGDIGLIFDDTSLKFIANQATFIDASVAKNTLMTVKERWDNYSDTIETIQVDGYIAHYGGNDTLSQPRADQVKKTLVELGIPADKISATGRGFGPFEQDAQNRMVKVTISRDSALCGE